MMTSLNRVYEALLYAGLLIAAVLIAAMAVLVSLDVGLRNVGWGSLAWVLEVSEYILFGSTFLAAPWVLRHGGHVRVDVVVRALGPRAAWAINTLANAVGLGVCLFLVIYGIRAALEAFLLYTQIFKHLVVPEWWLLIWIPLPSLLMTIEFSLRLAGLRGPDAAEGKQQPLTQDGF